MAKRGKDERIEPSFDGPAQKRGSGGLSVSEHTAVAVRPVRLPAAPTAMIVTAPAW